MAQNVDLDREYPSKTTVSETTEFKGVFRFADSLKINGKFTGQIKATGLFVLGPKSEMVGDIVCDEVIIGGQLKGNILANKRLELLSSARVYGDIKTSKLKIADGVVFEGKCEMITDLAEKTEV